MLRRELVVDKVEETVEGGKITSYRRETFGEAFRRNDEDLRKKLCELRSDHKLFYGLTSWMAMFGTCMVGGIVGAMLFGEKENQTNE